MLKTSVLHPEILAALASAGHRSKILISDGNYPHSTRSKPRAKIVWANFVPGVVDAVTVLKMICDLVPVGSGGGDGAYSAPAYMRCPRTRRSGHLSKMRAERIWANFTGGFHSAAKAGV